VPIETEHTPDKPKFGRSNWQRLATCARFAGGDRAIGAFGATAYEKLGFGMDQMA